MPKLKLFMVLLGCKPEGRHIEQHDIFFGIGQTLQELVPAMKEYWPGGRIHIDAWREVNTVEGWQVNVVPKETAASQPPTEKLFFINLGGYQHNKFEEQHYILLTVKPNKGAAFREAKNTLFYQHNRIEGGTSHIDDQYGVDVDDLYQIEEMLAPALKAQYTISLKPADNLAEDPLHLGYIKLME
jgi:hypothetical protein